MFSAHATGTFPALPLLNYLPFQLLLNSNTCNVEFHLFMQSKFCTIIQNWLILFKMYLSVEVKKPPYFVKWCLFYYLWNFVSILYFVTIPRSLLNYLQVVTIWTIRKSQPFSLFLKIAAPIGWAIKLLSLVLVSDYFLTQGNFHPMFWVWGPYNR